MKSFRGCPGRAHRGLGVIRWARVGRAASRSEAKGPQRSEGPGGPRNLPREESAQRRGNLSGRTVAANKPEAAQTKCSAAVPEPGFTVNKAAVDAHLLRKDLRPRYSTNPPRQRSGTASQRCMFREPLKTAVFSSTLAQARCNFRLCSFLEQIRPVLTRFSPLCSPLLTHSPLAGAPWSLMACSYRTHPPRHRGIWPGASSCSTQPSWSSPP